MLFCFSQRTSISWIVLLVASSKVRGRLFFRIVGGQKSAWPLISWLRSSLGYREVKAHIVSELQELALHFGVDGMIFCYILRRG